ncbi:MAG: glycosyltransferase family A protein [Microthrixaceae bacterium]|nr:glycosyltransferase family A protein [Gaiellaceae bacterium]
MPDEPLVSVVITVYNGAPYLAEAIESAHAQTWPHVEVVVVDDGSDDGSDEVARAHDVVFERLPERAGIGAARNRAASLASGEFVTFLDADDRFPPDKLEVQLAEFRRDPTLDVVYGQVTEFVSPDVSPEDAARIRPAVPRSESHLAGVMLMRRAAYDRVGPWALGLKVGTGVEWYMRSVELGLRTAVLDHVLLERRLHTANNGLREAEHRSQYLSIVKAALDRRRAGS